MEASTSGQQHPAAVKRTAVRRAKVLDLHVEEGLEWPGQQPQAWGDGWGDNPQQRRCNEATVEAREAAQRDAVHGHRAIVLSTAHSQAVVRAQRSEAHVASVQQQIADWSAQPQHCCSPGTFSSALIERHITVKYRAVDAYGDLQVPICRCRTCSKLF